MATAEHAPEPIRERTVRWQDPLVGAALIPTMSGLDYVRGMIDGRVPPPPIASHMNMRVVAAETGSTTFEFEPDESHYNPIGTVHGGLVCTLLDSAVGCAVQTTLPQGQGYTSIEIKVNYLRPVYGNLGTLTCIGTVTKPGRRVAFAEAQVMDAHGVLLATASSTLLVFPLVE
ncbi:PaaI family thioesterase [Leifsonia sp. Root112D2]|uniref:PaaI family thioesterase n=1 Tax=Leifsonia sp. Root112D2 TaxID=1736426 RepID=UPI0006FAB03F|nr:PaaI family thioesterase [Leifsonia sp. Root112D2]KQV07748.1 aromatic compound degradation protein PaaI [Leifsonia sp. Root112D2]